MKNKIVNIATLIGIVLAIIFGIYLPDIIKELSFLGTIYVNLLKFMIVPIVFSSIIVTIYNSKRKKDNILLKTLILFIVMFLVSTAGIRTKTRCPTRNSTRSARRRKNWATGVWKGARCT